MTKSSPDGEFTAEHAIRAGESRGCTASACCKLRLEPSHNDGTGSEGFQSRFIEGENPNGRRSKCEKPSIKAEAIRKDDAMAIAPLNAIKPMRAAASNLRNR